MSIDLIFFRYENVYDSYYLKKGEPLRGEYGHAFICEELRINPTEQQLYFISEDEPRMKRVPSLKKSSYEYEES